MQGHQRWCDVLCCIVIVIVQVIVRKMACHGGLAFGKDKAADRGAKAPHSKKRKAPNAGSKQRKPQAAGQSKKPKQA